MTLHLVPPLPATETPVRDQLEQLAHDSLAGKASDSDVIEKLADLVPHLDAEAALFAFRDLVDAVGAEDALQRGITHWSEVVEQDGTDLDEQAADSTRTHVELAIDALTWGAS